MAVPELNEDILIVICDFLTNVSDFCAISLASSSFRAVAIRRLLFIRSARLTSGAAIRRFHTFLFADAAARAPLVRSLDIEPGSFQPGEVSLLVNILASCQHLEHISLCRESSSPGLTEYPGVIDAIASIQSLRSLSFRTPAVDALALVRRISAPLRTLCLWCFYGLEFESELQFIWNLAVFQASLAHLAPTLEELGFHELVVDPEKVQELLDAEDPLPSPPALSWTRYPAVRSLSVTYFTGKVLLGPLQHLFPALDGTLAVGQADFDTSEEMFDTMRAANWRAQGEEGGWTKLSRVVCSAVAFYVLGLRCRIRLAILDAGDGYYTPEWQRRFVAVALRENPAQRLTLPLVLDDGLDVLDGLSGPELGSTLTHLTPVLDTVGHYAAEPPVRFGWGDLLDSVLSSLRPLHKLAHLRIVFYSESLEDTNTDESVNSGPSAPPMSGPAAADDLARTLHPSLLDLEGTAATVFRTLPSLQALFLAACGYFTRRVKAGDGEVTVKEPTGERWSVSRAWQVAERSTDGMWGREQTLVELKEEVAEAIIEREELVVPDACKVNRTRARSPLVLFVDPSRQYI